MKCKERKPEPAKLLQIAQVPNLIRNERDRESFNGRRFAAQTDLEF